MKTPTGVDVNALQFKYWVYDDFSEPEQAAEDYDWTVGYNCEIIENSTKYYNCHSYAWHNIEGNMSQSHLRWINDVDYYGNPTYNVHRYYSSTYSGGKPAYKQIGTNKRANLKVSYFPRDHSAVTTSNSQYYLSKWAWGPLVKHKPEQCPFYSNAQIKYYELNLIIQGSTSPLCNSQSRTFTENTLTDISISTQWSRTGIITSPMGGSDFYVVSANSSGSETASVSLSVTTPSGATASTSKTFWVGKPSFYLEGDDELPAGSAGIALVEYIGDDSPYTQGVYDVDWSSTGGLTNLRGDLTKCTYLALIGGPAYIYAEATNACGSIEERKAVDVTGGFFMLMPNPSDEYVEISTQSAIQGVNLNSTGTNEPFETGTIRIFDSFGILHSIVQLESKNQRISTIHLKEGVYVVEIKTKSRTERLNLIIKH